MSRKLRLAIAAAAGALALCLLIATGPAPREPTYKGFTMREWYDRLDDSHRYEALQILGTNNLDLLVDCLAQSQRRDRLRARLRKLPEKWRSRLVWLAAPGSRPLPSALDAAEVLAALGTNVMPALPKLKRVAEFGDRNDDTLAEFALFMISACGDEGLSTTAAVAAHPRAQIRLRALPFLANHPGSSIARSALTNALNDPAPEVRRAAWTYITNQAHYPAPAVIR